MDQARCRQTHRRAGFAARLVPLAIALLVALSPTTAGGALAKDWKTGQVRDLTFDIPAEWHFIFDAKDKAGGYAPDARSADDARYGVLVVPGRFADMIPEEAITGKTTLDIGGRTATEYHVQMPTEVDTEGRMIDIEGESIDGLPIGFALVGPTAKRDEWVPIFDRVLATARFTTDTFIVPEVDGLWYVGGRPDRVARAVGQSRDAYFSIDPHVDVMGDDRLEVVRLGPFVLRIVSGAPQLDGRIDPAGSQIDWDDGTRWTRTPEAGLAEAPEKPMSRAEPKAFAFGPLATRVPDNWAISTSSRDPLQSAYAIDPGHQGLAGAATLAVAADEAEAAFASYLEQANAVLLQSGRQVQGSAPEDPWTMSARYEGVMVWGADGAQPTMLEARAAPTATGLVMLFVAWPSYATQAAIDNGLAVLASATLATGAADEAGTGTVLFDGTLSDQWQELATAGGDFARFARFDDGALIVDVPAGNSWGKTGIWSREPVVDPVGKDGEGAGIRVSVSVDPDGTSGFVVALGARDTPEEWFSHDVRFGWSRNDDDASGAAVLMIRQHEVWRLATDGHAPAVVDLAIDGDGVATVTLPDGRRMEAAVPGGPPADGYRLYTLAHAPAENAAASLALREIVMKRGAADAGRSSLSIYPDDRDEIVLFDGGLGRAWVSHSAAGGDFARSARLDGDGLAIDVPEESGWGKVGILSPEPLVWLDAFGDDAEVTVEFAIDPERTDGFALALTVPGYGGVVGNDPSYPNALFQWLRTPDGSGSHAEFRLNPHRDGDFWSAEGGAAAPETVRFDFHPGEITVIANGFEPVTRPWSAAVDGAGFHVYAYSVASEADRATRFALKQIRLTRTMAEPSPPARPAAGVAPLPVVTLFDGDPGTLWEPIGINGAAFAEHGRFEDGRLAIEVPADAYSWGKTGLLSKQPGLALDERVWGTPHRVTIAVDPARTTGLQILFSAQPVADMWPSHDGGVSFIRQGDTYVLGLRTGIAPYNAWSRQVAAEWIENNWDGTLQIDNGQEWMAVGIPGGPVVRGTGFGIGNKARRFMTIVSHPATEHGRSTLVLKRITGQWVMPDGMTAEQRWVLVDDDDFDPDGFLAEIANF